MQADIEFSEMGQKPASCLSEHMPADMHHSFPDTLTLITTYQCNAACVDCCFECNPGVQGRLSLDAMTGYIDQAARDFQGLKLVVFSGGECFLLKKDLFRAIEHADRLSLRTRCVSNGFWGSTERFCRRTVNRLVAAGIDEVNLSTGRDHQQWIPAESVIRAARMLVENSIVTVVTVEMDARDNRCLKELMADPEIRRLIKQPDLFRLQCNSWMPFHEVSVRRGDLKDLSELRSGCKQLFRNVTVTPKGELSACCGLTMEHIPEMKLGKVSSGSALAGTYYRQLEDFLKIWIHVDGPYKIITRLFGEGAAEDLKDVVHICQACAILHKHPGIRQRLEQRYREFVPEIMSRFYLQQSIEVASDRTNEFRKESS